MALRRSREHENESYGGLEVAEDGRSCFYCGHEVSWPHIMWLGHDVLSIYMHVECTQKLVLRLSRDLWEASHAPNHPQITRKVGAK